MGLKLAEQLKLDNTAVQKRRNWTLAQKGMGVGSRGELFFLLLLLGIFLLLRESGIGNDLQVGVPFILNFGVKIPHHFKYSLSICKMVLVSLRILI